MQQVYLVCGVPGSGKSWVCEQLTNKYLYLPHDDFIGHDYAGALVQAASGSDRPILADCPFAERALRDKVMGLGIKVFPIFIVEHPQTVQARYEAREKKPVAKNTLTRAMSIQDRAEEWDAPWGTSNQVLNYLLELPV